MNLNLNRSLGEYDVGEQQRSPGKMTYEFKLIVPMNSE